MSNSKSRIVSEANEESYGGRTFTSGRQADAAFAAEAVTDSRKRTVLSLRRDGKKRLELNGVEARTVFRLLQQHYESLGQ